MTRIARSLLLSVIVMLWLHAPARADYAEARRQYEAMTGDQQTALALGLIASGDFEGLAEHGFTRLLYRAVLSFERREGFSPDGVLQQNERARLRQVAESFYARLGMKSFVHPDTGARLPVPRLLFDEEKRTPEGMIFARRDGMFSLIFLSFDQRRKSYDELWNTLSANAPDKRVTYKRRFPSHFVSTGFFKGRKFYTWMARSGGGSTTGFTVSWGEPWEDMGRKISVLLANSFLADSR